MIYASKLKKLIYQNNFTLTKVNNEINKRNRTNKSLQNLSNKLMRESLMHTEFLQIIDIIGCEVHVVPISNINTNTIFNINKRYVCEIGDDFCYF